MRFIFFLLPILLGLPAVAKDPVQISSVGFKQSAGTATLEFAWKANGVVKMPKPIFRAMVLYQDGLEPAAIAVSHEFDPAAESARVAKTSVPNNGTERLKVALPPRVTLHDFRVECWVNGKQLGKRHSPRFAKAYFDQKNLDATWWIPKTQEIDGDLGQRINEAIENARDYLLKEQARDGSWTSNEAEVTDLKPGYTAFCAYALLKSGSEKDDPAIQKAVAFLDDNEPTTTYGIACAIMLLEALDPVRHKASITKYAQTLIRWQANGTWDYEGGGGDLSNTQYGALGLWSAARAGVPVETSVWRHLGDALVKFNNPDGSFNYRILIRRNVAHRGTVPMTAAATGLSFICQRMLAGDQRSERTLKALGPMAVRGFGWLGRAFTPEVSNYSLYGIERVGALSGKALIGRHDWYVTGAKLLINRQQADGSFEEDHGGELAGTALALLFLRRSTATALDPEFDPEYSGGAAGDHAAVGGGEFPANAPEEDAFGGLVEESAPKSPREKALDAKFPFLDEGQTATLKSTDGRSITGTVVAFGDTHIELESNGRRGKIPFDRLEKTSRVRVDAAFRAKLLAQ